MSAFSTAETKAGFVGSWAGGISMRSSLEASSTDAGSTSLLVRFTSSDFSYPCPHVPDRCRASPRHHVPDAEL